MSDLVNIIVDGVEVQAPKGSTVVDAAMKANIKIPVFCHHPKLEPVGMCRMCLVQVGTPMFDRGSGEMLTNDDGSPQMRWGRGLQTGCTIRVSEGMQVITDRETGRSRGFGFVEMGNDDEARAAISAMNGADLQGRPLTVNEARPRPPRNDRRW